MVCNLYDEMIKISCITQQPTMRHDTKGFVVKVNSNMFLLMSTYIMFLFSEEKYAISMYKKHK